MKIKLVGASGGEVTGSAYIVRTKRATIHGGRRHVSGRPAKRGQEPLALGRPPGRDRRRPAHARPPRSHRPAAAAVQARVLRPGVCHGGDDRPGRDHPQGLRANSVARCRAENAQGGPARPAAGGAALRARGRRAVPLAGPRSEIPEARAGRRRHHRPLGRGRPHARLGLHRADGRGRRPQKGRRLLRRSWARRRCR